MLERGRNRCLRGFGPAEYNLVAGGRGTWVYAVDRFIAWENVKHLRGQLASEIDRKARSVQMKLLIEEEDKLGADFELLADLDRHIRRGLELIARQTVLVATMERDGHNGIVQAKTLLDCLVEGQNLHEGYRQKVLVSIEENKSLA